MNGMCVCVFGLSLVTLHAVTHRSDPLICDGAKNCRLTELLVLTK